MLYKLNKSDIANSERMPLCTPADAGLKEKDIENFFASKSRLSEIIHEDKLLLIGQERPMQEEADLLALDENGVLYIFELKRWESRQENILQVMRYGQIFGRYDYARLETLSKRQVGLGKSLCEAHKDYFDLDAPLPESKFNCDQVFVLITDGLDADTLSAVQYWSKKGVRIECAPYRIYYIGEEPYIRFHAYSPDHEFVVEHETNTFIVNTNKAWMEDAWKSMLGEKKASAYYDRKYNIAKIKKNDTVYLYHTGVGIIAKGVAKSGHKQTDVEGSSGEEFYIPLNFAWSLPEESWHAKAPKALQINERLGTGHRFRGTVFAIGDAMTNAIDDAYANNVKNT